MKLSKRGSRKVSRELFHLGVYFILLPLITPHFHPKTIDTVTALAISNYAGSSIIASRRWRKKLAKANQWVVILIVGFALGLIFTKVFA